MTSRLAVIAYPVLNEADLVRMQSVRERDDPQFRLLDPHFTLVFPVEARLSDVESDIEAVANSAAPFRVVVNAIRAVKDALGVGGHVCLVAEQGASEILELHAELYAGSLAWARRTDIPYLPHITVAADADFSRCEALARQLDDGLMASAGIVEALTIVDVSGRTVRPIATLPLKGMTG